MSLNLVGQSLNSGTSTSTQTTLVTPSGQTAGRLLIAQVGVIRSSGDALADISFSAGWTKVGFQGGVAIFNNGGAIAYRYATGDSDDNCQAFWGGTNCRFMMNVYEDDSGISGNPQTYTSAGSDAGATLAAPIITPTGQPATVFTFANLRRWEQWMTNVDGTPLAVDSGFTLDWRGGQGLSSDTVPGLGAAHLDITDTNAVQPEWSTTGGVGGTGGNATAFNLVFSTTAVGTEWTSVGITAVLDQVGLTGQENTATRLKCDTAEGTTIANGHAVASANNTTRWFIKRLIGTGDISITIDGGSTWSLAPAISSTEFTEVLLEQIGTNPSIGIKLGTSGDEVVVGNAELHFNMPASAVATSNFLMTTDTVVTGYSQAGAEQTGVWSPTAAWTNVPNNSRYLPMNDGPGSVEFADVLNPGGDTGATIENEGSPGGGWS